jgi:hypothetical protein
VVARGDSPQQAIKPEGEAFARVGGVHSHRSCCGLRPCSGRSPTGYDRAAIRCEWR